MTWVPGRRGDPSSPEANSRLFTKICRSLALLPTRRLTPLGRAPACSRVSPAASSIFRKRGGARPRAYPLFMRFRALLPTTWVWFRAESGWAGRRGGDGGERPGRAGPGQRSGASWGVTPAGCRPRVLPAVGVLALRSRGVQRGLHGERAWGVSGVRSPGTPEMSREVSPVPCTGEESRARGGSEPFPSAPSALGSEDGFPPQSPVHFCFHLQGELIILSFAPSGKRTPR